MGSYRSWDWVEIAGFVILAFAMVMIAVILML